MKNISILSAAALAAVLFIHPRLINAQQKAPGIQWEKFFGGSKDDQAFSVQQTFDNGYVVAGWSSSTDGDVTGNQGGHDYWVVKIDSIGNLQWEKSLGGSGAENIYDLWILPDMSIRQTNDSGFIIAGSSYSTDGDVTGHHGTTAVDDYWIVKLNKSGAMQWEKSLGGSREEEAHSVIQTTDGGYIVSGFSDSPDGDGDITGNHGGSRDYWIVKLDASGNIQWEKSIGGGYMDNGYAIQQTKDGGYIVTGYSRSNDGDVTGHHGTPGDHLDYWVVKLDDNGNIKWEKSLGGTDDDWACDVRQTFDGGYIVAGTAMSNDGDVTGNHHHTPGNWNVNSDYWVVKLDNSGNILWNKCYGGSGNDEAHSIQQTSDSGYVIAGMSDSYDGDITNSFNGYFYWIVKIDSVGTIQWDKSIGLGSFDYPYQIQQTRDSGYIIAGSTSDPTPGSGNSDYWIVKLGPPFFPEISSTNQQTLPTLTCSTSELDTVWVHNIGNESLNLTGNSFHGATANEFTLTAPSSFPVTVLPNDSVRFIVRFIGSTVGNKNDTLYIQNTDVAHNPWKMSFASRKDSIGFVLQNLNNDTLDFGDLICGTTEDRSITLVNTSSVASTFILRLTSAMFTTSFSGKLVNSNKQTAIDIHFHDVVPGFYIDSAMISDSCGKQQTIYFKAKVENIQFLIRDVASDTIDFGVILPGAAKDTTFVIANQSTLPTTFTIHASDSAFTLPASTFISYNSFTTIPVHFVGDTAAGKYFTIATITDTCGRTQKVYLAVTVKSGIPAGVQITDPIDAGYVHINTQKTVPFTIKNTGTSTITIDSMTLLGTDAQYYLLKNVPQLPFTIAAGNTQTMNITFSPVNAGVQDATLGIVTSLSPTAIDIAVTGIGTRSILQAEALHFDTVAVATCKTEAMKITNAGSYPLLITNVSLRGIYAGDYTVVSLPTDTLQAGDTADIMIKYCPTTLGEEDAIAQIVTSDGDTLDVNIYGAGSGPNAVHELLPTNTSLSQNYPNPFTATTTIHVELSRTDAQSARLKVYNVLGEEVADLTQELRQNADVVFTAKNMQAGVYYYTLETATRQLTRQMFIVK